MKHLRYLKYVLRHKYFVFIGCQKLGVSLWQALVHDWTKFLPSEWLPYVNYFYGDYPKYDPSYPMKWVNRGYYGKLDIDIADDFDRAWLRHQHRNPHHWQHWILREDDGETKIMIMPEIYVREMVADWYGAGMAMHGKNDVRTWWETTQDRRVLHPATHRRVAELVSLL